MRVRIDSATSDLVGWNTGIGDPAHTSTRTSTRSAISASSAPSTTIGSQREREARRQMPARDVHVLTGASDRLSNGRQRLCAIHEDVELVAGPRRRLPGRPQDIATRSQRP